MLTWAHTQGLTLRLIEPGKPNQDAYIESFNGRFRDECLNEHWFTTLAHAQALIEAWRCEYNEERPKKGLGGLTPALYAKQLAAERSTVTPGTLKPTATQGGGTSHGVLTRRPEWKSLIKTGERHMNTQRLLTVSMRLAKEVNSTVRIVVLLDQQLQEAINSPNENTQREVENSCAELTSELKQRAEQHIQPWVSFATR